MEEIGAEIAIVGATPMALLLAGLLAGRHGRKVTLVGRPANPERPADGLDLSVAPLLRPGLWAVLERTVPETARLLADLDRSLCEKIAVSMVFRGTRARAALPHLRHLAPGAAPDPADPDGRLNVRGALRLDRHRLFEAAPAWLAGAGVRHLPDEEIAIGEDGMALAESGAPLGRAVIAEESALLRHLRPAARARLGRTRPQRAFLTAPSARLPAPVVLDTDLGTILSQRADGVLDILADDAGGAAERRAAAALPLRPAPLRLGEAHLPGFASKDGAPLVGGFGNTCLMLGFGPPAAFLAPALARHLCGRATPLERAVLDALSPARDFRMSTVAEFVPPLGREAVP